MATATTQRAALVDLLTRLKAQLSDGLPATLSSSYVFMSADPGLIPAPPNSQYVQLVPGRVTARNPDSGDGIHTMEFRLSVWSRYSVDRPYDDTERITNATSGLLDLVDATRDAMIHYRSSIVIEPVAFIDGSEPRTNPFEDNSWAYIEDLYRCAYWRGNPS